LLNHDSGSCNGPRPTHDDADGGDLFVLSSAEDLVPRATAAAPEIWPG
jgi:hypothetical protein